MCTGHRYTTRDDTLHGEPAPDLPQDAVEEGTDLLLHDRRLNLGAQGPVRIGAVSPPYRTRIGPVISTPSVRAKVHCEQTTTVRQRVQ